MAAAAAGEDTEMADADGAAAAAEAAPAEGAQADGCVGDDSERGGSLHWASWQSARAKLHLCTSTQRKMLGAACGDSAEMCRRPLSDTHTLLRPSPALHAAVGLWLARHQSRVERRLRLLSKLRHPRRRPRSPHRSSTT